MLKFDLIDISTNQKSKKKILKLQRSIKLHYLRQYIFYKYQFIIKSFFLCLTNHHHIAEHHFDRVHIHNNTFRTQSCSECIYFFAIYHMLRLPKRTISKHHISDNFSKNLLSNRQLSDLFFLSHSNHFPTFRKLSWHHVSLIDEL